MLPLTAITLRLQSGQLQPHASPRATSSTLVMRPSVACAKASLTSVIVVMIIVHCLGLGQIIYRIAEHPVRGHIPLLVLEVLFLDEAVAFPSLNDLVEPTPVAFIRGITIKVLRHCNAEPIVGLGGGTKAAMLEHHVTQPYPIFIWIGGLHPHLEMIERLDKITIGDLYIVQLHPLRRLGRGHVALATIDADIPTTILVSDWRVEPFGHHLGHLVEHAAGAHSIDDAAGP